MAPAGASRLTTVLAPVTNADYWRTRIERNRQRDRDQQPRLGDAGWAVLCASDRKDVGRVVERVLTVLGSRS